MFEPQFFTLTSLYFLALLSPGQDFFLIVKHALAHGYRKAWWSCLGIASGNAFYIALAYIGHEFLSTYPTLLRFVETGGAIFLGYLGCLLLFAPAPALDRETRLNVTMAFKLFVQGVLSALLNPKNILFYFSLLFTIIKPETSLHVKIFYAVWMTVMLVAWDMSVAVFFTHAKQSRFFAYLHTLQKIIGAALIAFSVWHLYRDFFAFAIG